MSAPKRVFLIDDDEDDRFIFEEALHELGYAVECDYAPDATSALNKLQDNNTPLPDFIFLDLNMPTISGKQFLATIKQLPRLLHIPIIILTTSENYDDRAETQKLGAAHFMIKPHSINRLSHSLDELLSKDIKREPAENNRLASKSK